MLHRNQLMRLRLPAIITLGLIVCASAVLAAPPDRERLSFDSGWRFLKGDPEGISNELSYANIRPWVMATGNEFIKDGTNSARPDNDPGADVTFTKPDFDDRSWQSLTLPHDWGIGGPFDQKLPGETAKLPWS